jgi:hypothetical protein
MALSFLSFASDGSGSLIVPGLEEKSKITEVQVLG